MNRYELAILLVSAGLWLYGLYRYLKVTSEPDEELRVMRGNGRIYTEADLKSAQHVPHRNGVRRHQSGHEAA